MTQTAFLTDLPGPRGLPLLGNAHQISPVRLHLDLEAWADRYGPCYRFRIGRKAIVVLAAPEQILEVLRDRPETFRRLSAIEAVNRDLGVHGVFSAEGDRWRRHRELVMQGFDRTQLRGFFPTLVEIAKRLVRRWRPLASAASPFDGHMDLTRYTVDVTTNFVFGYDMNTLEQGSDTLQEHLAKILPMINRRINAPFPVWRYWKFRADNDLDRAIVAVKELCTSFLRASRIRLAEHTIDASGPALSAQASSLPSNLLEGFLATETGGAPIDEADIIGNAITMLLAGEDTSAHTLAWIIQYLCIHPDVQRQVQVEVDGLAEIPEPQDLDRLPYLDGVMQETMRLKSVAPILFLEANREVLIEDLLIPQGTGVMTLTRHACLQESNFTNARDFMPDRWLIPRDLARYPAHNKHALMPFGAGPRFCPGRQLAWIEMKLAIAELCRNFHIDADEDVEPPQERFGFTMMPNHLRIRLSPRFS